MRAVKAACDELLGQLKAAGFTGSHTDPEQVNPPAVWVQPRGIHDITLGGDGQLTVWLYALVGNVETEQAMSQLDDALEGLLELGLAFADVDEPIDLTAAVLLPHTTTPLPAYRLAIDLDL